ncbi:MULTISPECIES: hypothetical protein [Halomonadaceae]|uniref:hypothetical protein n=1 Tax=Halomonadaceae TaxID=28256 RepID=UPI001599F8AD|nr:MULTISPECIES: hypothetical protein [Halomonas]QJQ96034.1 hypothetical protein HIO72_12645 [Halomonas sp. PA5]
MCYVEDEYLAAPVVAEIQRIQASGTREEFYALAAVLEVASECMKNPSALDPIAIKHSHLGHPYTIAFRVYAIEGYEAIFTCPQHPLAFKVIYFGQAMEAGERIDKLAGDLRPYWRE